MFFTIFCSSRLTPLNISEKLNLILSLHFSLGVSVLLLPVVVVIVLLVLHNLAKAIAASIAVFGLHFLTASLKTQVDDDLFFSSLKHLQKVSFFCVF
jgi:hypothetical protein